MKESKIYWLAEMAVVNSSHLSTEEKLCVLRMFFEKEKFAIYSESLEERAESNG